MNQRRRTGVPPVQLVVRADAGQAGRLSYDDGLGRGA